MALALAVVTCAVVPTSAQAAGDSLQLVGEPEIDRQGILLPGKWTSITKSGAIWDTDGWLGEYSWTIPPSIPPAGADATLHLKATDKTGGRFAPAMAVTTNLFVEDGPARVDAYADKVAGPATAEADKKFTLVPGSYCDGCEIYVSVGIQDGPHIKFLYRVVPKPKGKPCRAGTIAIFARFSGPLLCHTDAPDPGETGRVQSGVLTPKAKRLDVDVSPSSGDLNGTTIVAEAEARRKRAEKIGTIVGACYFIGKAAFDYPSREIASIYESLLSQGRWADDNRPAGRLKNCINIVVALEERPDAAASARAAARGCSVRRIAFESKRRNGKLLGVKPAKSQRPSSSSVRYGCTGSSGGGLKITAKRPQGLRGAVGTKLDLGLVRAPNAPASGGTLSFRFR
jgi:hypothetical protein